MKRILFVSGTRADFGKLKPLMQVVDDHPDFELRIFATGMHMHAKYGSTVNEIEKCGFENIYRYINQTSEKRMDLALAKTIEGLSNYCMEFKSDLIVVHGDRVEALAAAIVGSLNNILVAHIEGGEVSGTVDELIRHAVSKMSHIHFVANDSAHTRLLQLGESTESVFTIGSPEVDLMNSDDLLPLEEVKSYYDLTFDSFGLVSFHPVTTEFSNMKEYVSNLVEALLDSENNYVVIYPNNDMGSNVIFQEYTAFKELPRFKVFPSIRFEYYLVLLKQADFIIGNSSSGIREAPYFGTPTINIGSRQYNRSDHPDIIHVDYSKSNISTAIESIKHINRKPVSLFGKGNSAKSFIEILVSDALWTIKKQKLFNDLLINEA